MNTWYDTPERIQLLDTVARSWLGTPFRENSAIKGPGGGVSCHYLTAFIPFETGAFPRFDVPRGSIRQFLNSAPQAMLDFIDGQLGERVGKIEPRLDAIWPGDILVLAENGRTKHAATAMPQGRFIHVLFHDGVLLSELADPTYKIEAIRRIKNHG